MSSQPESAQSQPKTLSELRVFELKQELEKRGLDKNGIKFALVERLETAIRDEGNDPKTFVFTTGDYSKNATAVKTGPTQESATEVEVNETTDDEDAVREDITEGEHKGENGEANGVTEDILAESEDREVTLESPLPSDDNEEVTREPAIVEGEPIEKMEESDEVVREVVTELGEELEKASANEKCEKTEEAVKDEQEELEKETKNAEAVEVFGGTAETVESAPPSGPPEAPPQPTHTSKKADNSLWIKGISPNTKAADLKALFSKYGRVVTAKIFTRRQQPSSACFGFVTMADCATADLCIHKLHKSNVKGRVILVERADRCNMPVVKSIPKKITAASATATKGTAGATSAAETTTNGDSSKPTAEKLTDEEKKEAGADDKAKPSAGGTAKSNAASRSEKQKSSKTASASKKTSAKVSATATSQSKSTNRTAVRRNVTATRQPPTFRNGRRVNDRAGRVSAVLRRSPGSGVRKPVYAGSLSRRPLMSSGHLIASDRLSRSLGHHDVSRRDVSRRAEPASSWDKREMMELLRRKEEEHRLKEQELRLQRERERLRFERERFERERLELQQLRQLAVFATPHIPAMIPARRSQEACEDIHSSSRRRGEYSRSAEDRSTSHRSSAVVSSRTSAPERRSDGRVSSSRHSSSAHRSSSRSTTDRDRDRSRHGREGYRANDSAYASSHRGSDSGYSSRDVGSYSGSSGTYSRDASSSSYAKESGGSSRAVGGSGTWSSVGGTLSYISSSRNYDSEGAWVPSIVPSQSHGVSASQWQSSRAVDSWPSGGYSSQDSHGASYEKSYDKYDSFDKFSRRY